VLIRAYDRPAGLAGAIDSVLAQTYGDFEIVVSDDSGRMGPIAGSFRDARVRYHPNPDPDGPAANLRRAVSLARGRLLAILNDDDSWEPSFLSTVVSMFDADPGLGVVFTDDFFEIAGRRVRRRLAYAPGRHDAFLRPLLEHSMPASAAVATRAVWEEGERTVPLRGDMIGDVTVWLRAAAAGHPFHYVSEPLAVSRLSREQLSWSDDSLPARAIASLTAFRFEDPLCEQLRRARLAEAFLARANVHLRRRQYRCARADIGRARATAGVGIRGILALAGVQRLAMGWMAYRPWALAPAIEAWRRVRPPLSRGGGDIAR
jgi:glycosyltransferase involved in cell wall biosynthesis